MRTRAQAAGDKATERVLMDHEMATDWRNIAWSGVEQAVAEADVIGAQAQLAI